MELLTPTQSLESPLSPFQTATSELYPAGRKLRLSCDACAAAKVKCDKARPRCGRCAGPGTTCVYGLSRKHGKSRSRSGQENPRRVSIGRDIRPSGRSGAILPALSEPERQRLLKECSTDRRYSDMPKSSPAWGRGNQPQQDEMTVDSAFFELDEQILILNPTSPYPTQPLETNNFLRTRGCGDTVTSDEDVPSISPSAMNFYGFASPDTLDSTDIPPSLTSQLSDSQSSVDLGNMDHNRPSERHSGCVGPHPCYALTNSTLASLQHQLYPVTPANARYETAPTSSSSSLLGPSEQTSALAYPPLDRVLRMNKIAMSNVQRLLNCPCAADPHLTMLFASIIVKVLMWYQTASGMDTPIPSSPSSAVLHTPWLGGDSSMVAEATRPRPLASPTTRSGIVLLPITIGEFDLDEEDKEALGRQFLLRELRKVGDIVDNLATMKFAVDKDDINRRTSDLYASLGGWLKTELSRTIRRIKQQHWRQQDADYG